MNTIRLIGWGLIIFTCFTGCGNPDMTTLKYKKDVEIAPGKWLTLEKEATVYKADLVRPKTDPHNMSPAEAIKQIASTSKRMPEKERSGISFEWNGKKVKWEGLEIPVTLREDKGNLFMIGFNRKDLNNCKLVYFKLNDKGTGFEKIEPKDFPRQIATQNMWLNPSGRYVNVYVPEEKDKNLRVDEWDVLRRLDINSPAFVSSETAKIWYTIETGTPYNEISSVGLNEKFLKDYVEKYHPIALPTIVKEEKYEEWKKFSEHKK